MNDGSEIILQIIIRIIFGAICAAVAHSKGRNAVGWFFGGFVIACLGLIILLCLSNLKEQEEQLRVQDDVNRRLREQLRQEQMKTEALRAHTAARLDAHDEVLGVNTRAAAPALLGAAPPLARIGGAMQNPTPAQVPQDDGTEWYYLDPNSIQNGPMSIIAVRAAIAQGKVNANTLVWHEDLAEWSLARDTTKLTHYFPNA